MTAWPATVPFIVSMRDLEYSGPQGDIAVFAPDVGEPKTRRRTTASYRRLAGQTPVLNATEFAAFETFWTTTLAGGVLPFTATHPITGASATFKPDGSGYTPTLVAPGKVRVRLSLIEQPA